MPVELQGNTKAKLNITYDVGMERSKISEISENHSESVQRLDVGIGHGLVGNSKQSR
jgi:hypothetical protein